MSTLYNEYLTGAERELAIIVAESDAEIAKLNVLYEAVDATLEANKLVAEAKVFAENGTYDDLTMLYTEAEKEANEQKEGIFRTIINAIKKLFERIKNFLAGKNTNDIPDEVEVDKETADHLNIIEKAKANIESGVNKFKSENYLGAIADFAKVVLPTAVGAGAAAATGVVIWKRDVIKAKLAACGGIRGAVGSAISAIEPKIDKIPLLPDDAKAKLKEGLDKLKKFIETASMKETKLWGFIEKAKEKVKGVVNKVKGSDAAEEPAVQSDTPAEGNEPAKAGDASNQNKNAILTDGSRNNYKTKFNLTDAEIDHVIEIYNSRQNTPKSNNGLKKLLNTAATHKKNGKDIFKVITESMSFDEIDLLDDETFFESEMIEMDCDELIEAFAEL